MAAKTPFSSRQLASLPSRNLLINGAFDFWQRGTTFASTTIRYTADRWAFRRSANAAGATLSRQAAGTALAYSDFYVRMQRDAADASTNEVFIVYPMETKDVLGLKGRQVTFSIKLRKGSTFTPAIVSIRIVGHTAVNATPNAFVGDLNVGTLDVATSGLSTSVFTEYTVTGTVPTTINSLQFVVITSGGFVGTAGAADYIELGEAYACEGTLTNGFRRAATNISEELLMCQRYYEKNYNVDVNPGTATAAGQARYENGSGVNTTDRKAAPIPFKVNKRTAPTVVFYDALGASGVLTVVTSGGGAVTDGQPAATFSFGEGSFCIGPQNTAVANRGWIVYWTADAEL